MSVCSTDELCSHPSAVCCSHTRGSNSSTSWEFIVIFMSSIRSPCFVLLLFCLCCLKQSKGCHQSLWHHCLLWALMTPHCRCFHGNKDITKFQVFQDHGAFVKMWCFVKMEDRINSNTCSHLLVTCLHDITIHYCIICLCGNSRQSSVCW